MSQSDLSIMQDRPALFALVGEMQDAFLALPGSRELTRTLAVECLKQEVQFLKDEEQRRNERERYFLVDI